MITRLFQSKWMVLIGVLAVVGMTAGPVLADGHHHHDGFRGSFGGRHFVPSYGYSRPYYVAPYPYYSPPVVLPAPCLPYCGGGAGFRYGGTGCGVTIYVR